MLELPVVGVQAEFLNLEDFLRSQVGHDDLNVKEVVMVMTMVDVSLELLNLNP